MRRIVVRTVAALLLIAVTVIAAAYIYLRQSLPVIDGETRVAGISAPIEIVRDADGIPHILASTKLDGLYGLTGDVTISAWPLGKRPVNGVASGSTPGVASARIEKR